MAKNRLRFVWRTGATVVLFLILLGTAGTGDSVVAQSLFEDAVADSGIRDDRDMDPEFEQTRHDPVLEIRGHIRGAMFGSSDGREIRETRTSGTVNVFVEPTDQVSGLLSITADQERARLQETRVSWRSGGAGSVRLLGGYTILAFGRTDGIAPTDIINPIVPSATAIDLDDQRLSRFLISGEVRRGSLRTQLVLLPDYVGREPPDGTVPIDYDYPDRAVAVKDVGLAGRVSWDAPGFSGSLVGYRGPNPEFGIVGAGGTDVSLSAKVSSVIMGGVNAEVPFGAQVFRLDAAYRHPRGDHHDPAVPRPDVRSVAAVERSLGSRIILLMQYRNTWVRDWKEHTTTGPSAMVSSRNAILFGQTHPVQHAVDANVTFNNRYNTLQFSAAGQYSVTTNEYMVRSTIEYNVGAGARVRGGYRYADGPEGTRFGLAGAALSGPFLEATFQF